MKSSLAVLAWAPQYRGPLVFFNVDYGYDVHRGTVEANQTVEKFIERAGSLNAGPILEGDPSC